MANANRKSKRRESLDISRVDCVRRVEGADALPFFLRAWWLRDRKHNDDLMYGAGNTATLPIWNAHSDPLCDSANVDSSL
jgi:hypothetical protein